MIDVSTTPPFSFVGSPRTHLGLPYELLKVTHCSVNPIRS